MLEKLVTLSSGPLRASPIGTLRLRSDWQKQCVKMQRPRSFKWVYPQHPTALVQWVGGCHCRCIWKEKCRIVHKKSWFWSWIGPWLNRMPFCNKVHWPMKLKCKCMFQVKYPYVAFTVWQCAKMLRNLQTKYFAWSVIQTYSVTWKACHRKGGKTQWIVPMRIVAHMFRTSLLEAIHGVAWDSVTTSNRENYL